MRQPQLTKASEGCEGSAPAADGSSAPMTRNRPLPMMKPSGAPSCGKVPYRARLPLGAFSVATRAAPLHSPPSAKPCASRISTSSAVATQPAWA